MCIYMQKISFISTSFGNAWLSQSKTIVSICRTCSCLFAYQKINFMTTFFLKVLQKNSKLFWGGNLDMPGYTHLKWYHQFKETCDVYLQGKINMILQVFLEILQRYCKFINLGTLGIPGYPNPKWYYQLVENFCVYLQAKKSTSSHTFFWRYCKEIHNSYFGYFRHAKLRTPKMILSTSRKLQVLSAYQKYTSSFASFLRYYILKNPPIWLI